MTTSVEFKWTNNTTEHDEYMIYRNTTPFTSDSLPSPFTTLPSSSNTFNDNTPVLGIHFTICSQ